jgi:hypothetical protein
VALSFLYRLLRSLIEFARVHRMDAIDKDAEILYYRQIIGRLKGQGEGSLRPCPLGSTVVHAGGASRSTSVAPDLDAIAARSRAGQGTVPGEQATGAGSVQRRLLCPRAAVPDAPPVFARPQPRGEP